MNHGIPDPRPELDGRGLRVAIVVSRFNWEITQALASGAERALQAAGVAPQDILVCHVPGAFELAPTARRLAQAAGHAAVVCLGAVIEGGTDHYRYVCEATTQGLTQVALEASAWGPGGVAVAFGVLTTRTLAQAAERAGGDAGNKGEDAALAALETALLWRDLARDATPPTAPVRRA